MSREQKQKHQHTERNACSACGGTDFRAMRAQHLGTWGLRLLIGTLFAGALLQLIGFLATASGREFVTSETLPLVIALGPVLALLAVVTLLFGARSMWLRICNDCGLTVAFDSIVTHEAAGLCQTCGRRSDEPLGASDRP